MSTCTCSAGATAFGDHAYNCPLRSGPNPMTRPAAPLEKAVEEAREAQRRYDSCPAEAKGNCVTCTPRLYTALRLLLAALDADKRLEEAEEALREIAAKAGFADECGRFDVVGDFHECDDQVPREDWCSVCIARRYFARREEKGENRGH